MSAVEGRGCDVVGSSTLGGGTTDGQSDRALLKETSLDDQPEWSQVEQHATRRHDNADPKPPSTRPTRFGLSALLRFFSFRRKKKFKPGDGDVGDKRNDPSYQSWPRKKKKDAKESDAAETNSQSTATSSAFSRLVRTFSFLYKRNPQAANLKRSKSERNYRASRSLPNIKYSNQTRPVRSPSSTSSPLSQSSTRTAPVSRNPRVDPVKMESKVVPNHVQTDSVDGHQTRRISQPRLIDVEPLVISTPPKSEVIEQRVGQLSNQRRHLVSSGLDTPGVCGIQNHGNTCFINSIIQCLCNTNPLAEYFVLDYYRDDLVQHGRLLSKKYGTRGELTEQLAIFLKSLWSCMYSSDISQKFKKTMSKYGEQYTGYDQHDAQEFLLWLLDKCHEDLSVHSTKGNGKSLLSMIKGNGNNGNGTNKKTITTKKHSLERTLSDETAAVEFLARCQTTHSASIIYDLFQGQLRSMITCPNCRHHSKTFDPYLCISLPVPIRLKLTIFVHAITRENDSTSIGMYGISIEAAATLRDLRDKISRMIKVPERRLILLQTDQRHGIVEFANDAEMVQEIFEDCETIYALETPEPPMEPTSLNGPTSDEDMYQQIITVVWLNRIGVDREGPLLGPLFTTLLSREVSYHKLKSTILATMAPFVIERDQVDFDKLAGQIDLRLRVLGGIPGKDYLSPEVDHPLFVPTVERALSRTENRKLYRGPCHIKLMVEWDLDVRRAVLIEDEQFDQVYSRSAMFIDKSVELAKECSKLNNRTTLQDCLDMYFRDENLTAENAWWCTSCNSRQQSVKQLNVWSLPDVLILHLKRFRYISNVRRIKINTMIDYPQNGLDMLKYVAQRKMDSSSGSEMANHRPSSGSSARLTFRKRVQSPLDETTYNLYAVCCHHGNMQGGHYTAYCKNSVDNCWYLFDDTKVIPVMEDAVVAPDAYILFYQKSYVSVAYSEPRTGPSSVSSGYFSAPGGSSFNIAHWAFHMPPFTYYQNNPRSNTLPSRKVISTANSQQQQQQQQHKPHHQMANGGLRTHAATGQNGPITHHAQSKSYLNSHHGNSSHHNTFPRVKSKIPSH